MSATPTAFRNRSVLIAVAGSLICFFAWFGHASSERAAVVTPPHSAIPAMNGNLYALLADGFLKGHLSLDAPVPPPLVQASNPYNPATRPPVVVLHDASYYRGRYYLYFGPAPAVLFFLPLRILTGHEVSSAAAVIVFCCLGYIGLIALCSAAMPRPSRSPALAAAIAVLFTLAGNSFMLALLRRPMVYEVAIAAGLCFSAWAFFILLTLARLRRPMLGSLLAGLALGLAVASRPTYILAYVPLGLGILFISRDRTPKARWRDLFAATSAIGLVVLCLGLYNLRRFGNPFEFGLKYQLTSADEASIRHFSLSYVPYQIRAYFLSPLHFDRYFPFFHPVAPPGAPHGMSGYEYVFGLFANLPGAVFIIVALISLLAARRDGSREAVIILLGACCATLLPIISLFASCVRYMADFCPALAVIASLGMLFCVDWVRSRQPAVGVCVAIVAMACAVASFGVVFLASIDMYGDFSQSSDSGLQAIERALDRATVVRNEAHGIRFGPRSIRLILPERKAGTEPIITARSSAGHWDSVRIEYVGPDAIRFLFVRDGFKPVDRSSLIRRGEKTQPHTLVLSLGALLPLRPGEARGDLSRADLNSDRLWTHVEFDGRTVLNAPIAPRPERFENVSIGRDVAGGPGDLFSGQILESKVLAPDTAYLRERSFGGMDVRLQVTPDMAGRTFPLASTGQPEIGNILSIAVGTDGRIRFGYDHWGKPTIWSPFIKVETNGRHRIEFWMPSIIPRNPPIPLIVRWDGETAWKTYVPYYVCHPADVFPGREPLGGSTTEDRLPNARFEAVDLPRPEQEAGAEIRAAGPRA